MEQRTVLGQMTNFNNSNKRKSLLAGFKPGGGKFQSSAKSNASRMSLGPGLAGFSRTSLGASTTKNNRRKSSVGTSFSNAKNNNNKRTSMIGGSSLKISDPRPIATKSFMHGGIRKLIEFLSEHNYDHPIAPKVLQRPTGKDFQNILQFLFLMVDRNLRFSQKFTDEVPAIFKGLKYPFNISKTSLSAVGSMHTWPPLLASLIWLVELLECHELELERDLQLDECGEKMFFTYLRKGYQSFLCGDDDKYEELEQELIQSFQERDEEIQQQIQEELTRGQELLNELEKLKNEESPLRALETKKNDFECDKAKFKQLIAKLHEHKDGLEAKNREKEAEVNARNEEYLEAEKHKERFQRKLDDQEISAEDAERMNFEKDRLNQEQTKVKEERDDIEKEIDQLEMEIARRLEGLSEAVKTYNKTCTSLKLIPRSAQNSQGVDFELKVNAVGYSRGEGFLNSDVSKTLKPALKQLKEFATKKTGEAKTNCMELQDQVEQNAEEKTAIEKELQVAEDMFKKLEVQNANEKEKIENELDILSTEKAKLGAELESARGFGLGANKVDESKKLLIKAEQTLAEERNSFEKQEAEMETQMHSFLDMVLEHKQQVEDILSSVLAKQQGRLEVCETESEEKYAAFGGLLDLQ